VAETKTIGTKETPRQGAVTEQKLAGVSWRAILLGLILTCVIDLWLHYTELVVGANRGHTALSNTSIPIGAFSVLFVLVMLSKLWGLIFRRLVSITGELGPFLTGILRPLSQTELLTIYVMCAVSTVMSSSGGIHFLMPTITAAHYFANDVNGWGNVFLNYIPHWIAQTDPGQLKAFYFGQAYMGAHYEPIKWAYQVLAWTGFMFVFGCATLCLSLILRKQWIDREHLPFPTVALPLEIAKEDTPIFKDSLFWTGAGIAFGIVWLNTLAWNYPNIPQINLRGIPIDFSKSAPPWDALQSLKFSFFPFAIGIAYLLSTDVVFSVWFFYLFSKFQQVLGSALGLTATAGSTVQSSFPYLSHQGCGAFLGLAMLTLWVSRRHLKEVFKIAFSFEGKVDPEERGYKIAVFGFILSVMGMIGFACKAGASPLVATIFVLLVLVLLLAATRLRAETGNAWPVGPEVDSFRLMTTAVGSKPFGTADLTTITYMRTATASIDFRGTCMPHQFDGLKIADSSGIKPGRLAGAMALAVGFGVAASMLIALYVWTKYGALAKTNNWRSMSGFRTFDTLSNWFKNPIRPDAGGMAGIGGGMAFTLLLGYCRARWAAWPFHPVGYAMSNMFTASGSFWFPCFIAWLCKIVIIRAGGMKLYRKMLPLFFGLIVGDILGGGTTDLLGCLTTFNVYPMNW